MSTPLPPPTISISQTHDLVTAFIRNAEQRGLSLETIRWYNSYLDRFTITHPGIIPMSPEPLESFIASYTSGDERRHGAYRALRAFYGFCSKRYDLANPMDKVKPPRRRHKEKSALSIDELKQLLEADIKPEWVKTLVWLLADSGCRIGEVVGVNKDDIYQDTIKVNGKTGQRIVPISSITKQKLLELSGYTLFPYSNSWMRHSVKRAFSQAGLTGSAHLLRHTFCSLFDGSDLALKDILGHSSFTMVNQYRHAKDAKAIQEHHQHSPVVKILAARRIGELVPAEQGSRTDLSEERTSLPVTKQRLSEFRKLAEVPLLPVIVDLAKEVGELKARVDQLESAFKLVSMKIN